MANGAMKAAAAGVGEPAAHLTAVVEGLDLGEQRVQRDREGVVEVVDLAVVDAERSRRLQLLHREGLPPRRRGVGRARREPLVEGAVDGCAARALAVVDPAGVAARPLEVREDLRAAIARGARLGEERGRVRRIEVAIAARRVAAPDPRRVVRNGDEIVGAELQAAHRAPCAGVLRDRGNAGLRASGRVDRLVVVGSPMARGRREREGQDETSERREPMEHGLTKASRAPPPTSQ
jgi:hypothetical protein